jgi:hypothetical protein
MPKEGLDSSAIAAAEYRAAQRQLDIELTNGRTYRYFDVPPSVHGDFMAAASKSRYYNDHIRDAYQCERIA